MLYRPIPQDNQDQVTFRCDTLVQRRDFPH